MLTKLPIKRNLYKYSQCSIVQGSYYKKKSVFDQAHLNPYHIYSTKQLKRSCVDKFNDPNYEWKELAPAVKEDSKELIKILEKEELNKIKSLRVLKRDPISLGDKVEVEYYHSISSQKLYKYRGVVLFLSKQGSLVSSFKFLSLIGGSWVILHYPFYSPVLASVKVLNKGNQGKRRKVYHIRKVNELGHRLINFVKGKNMNMNKKSKQRVKMEENEELKF